MAAAAAAKSLQLCLTLSDPMDCSPPGSSIHGIFQARVLEWAAIAFSNRNWQDNSKMYVEKTRICNRQSWSTYTNVSLLQNYRNYDSMVDFSGGTVDKNPSANAGDMGSIPGPRRSYMLLSN